MIKFTSGVEWKQLITFNRKRKIMKSQHQHVSEILSKGLRNAKIEQTIFPSGASLIEVRICDRLFVIEIESAIEKNGDLELKLSEIGENDIFDGSSPYIIYYSVKDIIDIIFKAVGP